MLIAMIDEDFIRRALALAKRAEGKTSPNPMVGALIVKNKKIIAEGYHRKAGTAHAEVIAIAGAGSNAAGSTLYVTLEPCAMCAGAIVLARVNRLVYGPDDPKAGATGSIFNITDHPALNHHPVIRAGLMADESSRLLREFFATRRERDPL